MCCALFVVWAAYLAGLSLLIDHHYLRYMYCTPLKWPNNNNNNRQFINLIDFQRIFQSAKHTFCCCDQNGKRNKNPFNFLSLPRFLAPMLSISFFFLEFMCFVWAIEFHSNQIWMRSLMIEHIYIYCCCDLISINKWEIETHTQNTCRLDFSGREENLLSVLLDAVRTNGHTKRIPLYEGTKTATETWRKRERKRSSEMC